MIYVMLVPPLGYLPSTLLFTVTLALRLGYRAPRTLLATAVFGVLVVVLFKSLLHVKVPDGQVYEHLPGTFRSIMLTYF